MKKHLSFVVAFTFCILTLTGCRAVRYEYNQTNESNQNLPESSDFDLKNHTYLLLDNKFVTISLLFYSDINTGQNEYLIKAEKKIDKISTVRLSRYIFNNSIETSASKYDDIQFESNNKIAFFDKTSFLKDSFTTAIEDIGLDMIKSFGCHVIISEDAFGISDESCLWKGDIELAFNEPIQFGFICDDVFGAKAEKQKLGSNNGVELTLISFGDCDIATKPSSKSVSCIIYAYNTNTYPMIVHLKNVVANKFSFEPKSTTRAIISENEGSYMFNEFSYSEFERLLNGIETLSLSISSSSYVDYEYDGDQYTALYPVELTNVGVNTLNQKSGSNLITDKYLKIDLIEQINEENNYNVALLSIENLSDKYIELGLYEKDETGKLQEHSNFDASCKIAPGSIEYVYIQYSNLFYYTDVREYVKGEYDAEFLFHVVADNYTYFTESFNVRI